MIDQHQIEECKATMRLSMDAIAKEVSAYGELPHAKKLKAAIQLALRCIEAVEFAADHNNWASYDTGGGEDTVFLSPIRNAPDWLFFQQALTGHNPREQAILDSITALGEGRTVTIKKSELDQGLANLLNIDA